ncbi:MAG TPA: Mini-ribonuclease 3 [Firmicutes bacterium]|nr:Mini-ribonuclease 3 [Bacillota bacterium]
MNILVLAYLGDAVFELYVREHLINIGIAKVKDLQLESIKYVSAVSQVDILNKLIEDGILKDEEIEIVKRGRNAHSHQSKSTDIVTYKKATGFEALIGYLYLNDRKRLEQLLKEALK